MNFNKNTAKLLFISSIIIFNMNANASWLSNTIDRARDSVEDTLEGDPRHIINGLDCAAKAATVAAAGGACIVAVDSGNVAGAVVACSVTHSEAKKLIKCGR